MGEITIELEETLLVANIESFYEKLLTIDLKGKIQLDANQLTKIDYAGIQVLLSFKETLKKDGGEMEIIGLAENIKEDIQMIGAGDFLNG